jgi:hypothetical protein
LYITDYNILHQRLESNPLPADYEFGTETANYSALTQTGENMKEETLDLRLPTNTDQKLLVAASIAQTAAILWVSGSYVAEEAAIGKAMRFYAEVVNIIGSSG